MSSVVTPCLALPVSPQAVWSLSEQLQVDRRTVSKKIPDYLKLHVEELPANRPEPKDIAPLEPVCRAFQQLTGWQLGYGGQHDLPANAGWSMAIDAGDCPAQLTLSRASAVRDGEPLERVQPLAQALGTLVQELVSAQSAVWRLEAELAAGIPVTLRPEDQRSLAHRLESVLRGGAEAIGCQAAALYLLDDATSHLKLRAAWQLPKSRFWESPRPLRGAAADLEALIGHAVALEDTSLLPHWNAPEQFPAALCVPVSTSSTPLGTLWFFADRVRDFTSEQTHMAEIIAGRLVSDLEREVLVREGVRQRQSDVAHQMLVNWQDEQRPRVPPLIEGWQVSGQSSQTDKVGELFYDWCILADGRIAVAMGHAEGPAVESGLTITMLQIAMRSHAMYPHEPRQMLDRLSESLWTHSTGNRFASLFYAVIDPETGETQYAAAGETHALICGPRLCDSLTDSGPLLGFDPDHRYRQVSRNLDLGQSLVMFSRSVQSPLDEELCEPDECRVVERLQSLHQPTAEEQVQAVFNELMSHSTHDRTAVVVRRIY